MPKTRWTLFFFLVGLTLIPVSAKADELAPGGSGSPDLFTLGYSSGPPTRTVVAASPTSPYPTWGSGSFAGQFYEQVESDPGNVYCSGCLDFIFQVANNSTSTENITGITQAGFSGFQTDVGYDLLSVGSGTLCGPDDNGFCNSGNPNTVPSSVNRSSSGDVLGFVLVGVPAGDSTVDLVIETNATIYSSTLMTIQGSTGGQATLDAFAPSGPPNSITPELPTGLLMATGLLGFLALRKKNLSRLFEG